MARGEIGRLAMGLRKPAVIWAVFFPLPLNV
jgi:hypothetical protein